MSGSASGFREHYLKPIILTNQFIKSDPVHGRTVKNKLKTHGAKVIGASVGALVAHQSALKLSKSVPRGAPVVVFAAVVSSPFFGGFVGVSLAKGFAKWRYPASEQDYHDAAIKYANFMDQHLS